MKKLLFSLTGLVLVTVASQGQVLLSGGTYTQNFDSLGSAAGANTMSWSDNTTLVGWYASRAFSTAPSIAGSTYGPYMYSSIRVDDGSQNSGWVYNYGTTNTGTSTDLDRALGSISSGTPKSNAIAMRIQNDTGGVWTGDVGISYTGEQWRNGGNTTAQTILAASYKINPTLAGSPATINLDVAGWTAVAGLNFVSPTVGATASKLNGNLTGNQASLSATLTGLTLNAGDELWFRWIDIDDPSNDHGGAIDNLTATFTAVPEPTSAILGGLGLLALTILRRRN